jgi:hypothetical protein
MTEQLRVRGLVLLAIALAFGIGSARYELGTLSRAGPGLFPLMISSLVGLIGLVLLVRSFLESSEPVHFFIRNIAIVAAALAGFVVIAEHVDVVAAIIYLVFLSTAAGSDYSVLRNVKICAALIAIAFAFHYLLGVQLRLI